MSTDLHPQHPHARHPQQLASAVTLVAVAIAVGAAAMAVRVFRFERREPQPLVVQDFLLILDEAAQPGHLIGQKIRRFSLCGHVYPPCPLFQICRFGLALAIGVTRGTARSLRATLARAVRSTCVG